MAAVSEGVLVGPAVAFGLIEEARLDEVVEVRIETTVVDAVAVVGFDGVLDGGTFVGIVSGDGPQAIALERGAFGEGVVWFG